MGTKNNVNPDHYKTAGRERPGQDVVQEIQKQKYTQAQTNNETGSEFIPGSGKKEKEFAEKGTGNVNKSADSSSNS